MFSTISLPSGYRSLLDPEPDYFSDRIKNAIDQKLLQCENLKTEMITKLKNSVDFRRQFEAALDDATRVALCLQHDCIKRLSGQMIDHFRLRTGECLQQLNKVIAKSKAQTEESVSPVSIINLINSRYKAQKKCSQLSEKVAIEAHESSSNGRRLVAVEKIEFGEILALPSPYVSVLFPTFEGTNCHHCCREVFADMTHPNRPHPCPDCAVVIYCSDQCRSTALSTYHRFECGHFLMLHFFSGTNYLALRLFLMHKPEEILEAQESEHILTDPVNYSHINQLMVGTEKKESYEEALKKTITACIYVRFLKETGYITSAPEQCTESWVGAVLLRHLRQVACISMTTTVENTTSPYTAPWWPPNPIYFTIQVFPFAALFNHSCAPNGNLAMMPNRRDSAIFATRSIAPGEEVTIAVNSITVEKFLSLEERQKKIKKKSGFECKSARCNLERKDTPDGAKGYYALACEACDGLIEKDADSESFQCTDCYLQLSPDECKRRHTKVERLIEEFTSLLFAGSSLDKASQAHMEKIYAKVKTLLHVTSCQLADLCAQVVDIYFSMNQLEKAVGFAEEHIRLVSKCYGEESMKILQVLEEYGRKIKVMMPSPRDAKTKKALEKKTGQLEAIESRSSEMEERLKKLKQMYKL